MKITKVDRVLYFKTINGIVRTLGEFEQEFGFEPDGVNFYYGIEETNVQRFAVSGKALNATHKAFFDGVLSFLIAGQQPEKTVVLGLQPPKNEAITAPFDFVFANLNLVGKL